MVVDHVTRHSGLFTYGRSGLRKGDEHSAYTLLGKYDIV